jgi:hypothetical protein
VAALGENVQSAISAAVTATAGESDTVKAASAAAAAAIPPPPLTDVGALWKMLVGGLLVILLAARIGIIWAVVDKRTTDVLVTVFTSSLTALIGLFVKSPSQ